MYLKCAGALLFMVLLFSVFPLRTAQAADWTLSPFRAQVAIGISDNESVDSSAGDAGMPAGKSIGRAIMFSLIVPGTGQLYAGSWWRGIPWFLIEIGSWAAFAHYNQAGNDKTDEFERFARTHFDMNRYLQQEYAVATNPAIHDSLTFPAYRGTYDQWIDLDWQGATSGDSGRVDFLPAPFTHDVIGAWENDQQQYYEMIGKYLMQFGFGWDDITGDNPATVAFDGFSANFFSYADMRGEANDLLNKGNVAMEVVLVNHILSALDAAFTARSYNRRHADSALPTIGHLKLRYDAHPVNGSMARFLKLSIPIN